MIMATRNTHEIGIAFGLVARASGGAFREDTLITDQNKADYRHLCAKWYLIESRRPQLEALREGFRSIVPEIQDGLRTLQFSGHELMLLCCGTLEPLSARRLKQMTVFSGFPVDSNTPQLVEALFDELFQSNPQSLNHFFEFVTGLPTVPLVMPEGRGRIVVQRVAGDTNKLPLAHTCFWSLDMPDYRNADLLRQKMNIVLESFQNSPFLNV